MFKVIGCVLLMWMVSSAIVKAVQDSGSAGQPVGDEGLDRLIAVFSTDKGDIYVQLFADQTPVTVASFANLAERGYYDGLKFHRVLDNFMIQGGDPTGTGRSGPGYTFEDETTSELSGPPARAAACHARSAPLRPRRTPRRPARDRDACG